ncbi:hypothetical protein BC835DRAFT_506995 [Cytidiella melzeri]|nr:hypothetical protein BC835DRAFT_506995 [Cytidiella melzeri]
MSVRRFVTELLVCQSSQVPECISRGGLLCIGGPLISSRFARSLDLPNAREPCKATRQGSIVNLSTPSLSSRVCKRKAVRRPPGGSFEMEYPQRVRASAPLRHRERTSAQISSVCNYLDVYCFHWLPGVCAASRSTCAAYDQDKWDYGATNAISIRRRHNAQVPGATSEYSILNRTFRLEFQLQISNISHRPQDTHMNFITVDQTPRKR